MMYSGGVPEDMLDGWWKPQQHASAAGRIDELQHTQRHSEEHDEVSKRFLVHLI
jgi:hypothetical protein